ncbi:MAG: cytochrome c biogenesis protein CcsA [Myxococcota bacterium]
MGQAPAPLDHGAMDVFDPWHHHGSLVGLRGFGVGGYWAWQDPVENASFLPWLAATVYLHSTLVTERKKILKPWTLAMVLAAFLLTVLGTFMTRSGVFNSVHSFTQSDIGPVFLLLLVVSLGLLAGQAHLFGTPKVASRVLEVERRRFVNNTLFCRFYLHRFAGHGISVAG